MTASRGTPEGPDAMAGMVAEMVKQASLGHKLFCVGVHEHEGGELEFEWMDWADAFARLAALRSPVAPSGEPDTFDYDDEADDILSALKVCTRGGVAADCASCRTIILHALKKMRKAAPPLAREDARRIEAMRAIEALEVEVHYLGNENPDMAWRAIGRAFKGRAFGPDPITAIDAARAATDPSTESK